MSEWIVRPQPQQSPQLRLLCFAYAGGSAWIFRPWAKQVPSHIEVCAIELPGRGKRLTEPAMTALPALIAELGPQMLPLLNQPFAFFGHSMGALIAFELCRWLRQTVQCLPHQLWVSAARAPHQPVAPPLMHTLSKEDFIARLQQYQGTPTSVLNNPELMDLMLPVLRADFTLLETYQHLPGEPFTFPITGLWGQQDTIVTKSEVAAWQTHTYQFHLWETWGDHFFIQRPLFIKQLLPQLSEIIQRSA
ncbi:MAG: alpha/beta fold hydrolase [Cyanobacteria bacterium J06631_9]